MNHLIVMPVIIYLAAAFIIPLIFRKRGEGAGIFCLLAVIAALASVLLLGRDLLSEGMLIYYVGGWSQPLGIALMVDPLSYIFLVVVNFIALFVVLYSRTYMRKYTGSVNFYVLVLIMMAGMNGMLCAMDFFNLFVFFEMASLASYILVAFGLRAEELEASLKYTVIGFVASTMILLGIALVYGLTGTLNISEFMQATGSIDVYRLWFIAGLFLSGFAVKTALVPFHSWLPDAHSMAPAPVSSLLSGLFVKVVGFYGIIRVANNIFYGVNGIDNLLLLFGVASIFYGGLMAYGQKNIKRIYAYSTISQMGFCAVGLGIGGYWGYLGALMHFIAHAFSKSMLFLNIGATEYMFGTTNTDELSGLNDSMPLTTMLASTGMLGLAGVPPMGNFWSKIIIIFAAVQYGYFAVGMLCVAGAIITLGYFLNLQRISYYNSPAERPAVNEAPPGLLVPMFVLGFMALAVGVILIPGLRELLLDRAVDVMQNFSYADIIH